MGRIFGKHIDNENRVGQHSEELVRMGCEIGQLYRCDGEMLASHGGSSSQIVFCYGNGSWVVLLTRVEGFTTECDGEYTELGRI
jgi:hypothetical protein